MTIVRRYEFSDEDWAQIARLLPKQQRGGKWNDHRTVMNGMFKRSKLSGSVSGSNMHRSAWVCTSTAWQLPQTPQAPAGEGFSHSHARASASASSN